VILKGLREGEGGELLCSSCASDGEATIDKRAPRDDRDKQIGVSVTLQVKVADKTGTSRIPSAGIRRIPGPP
jgi:hypothetical protein